MQHAYRYHGHGCMVRSEGEAAYVFDCNFDLRLGIPLWFNRGGKCIPSTSFHVQFLQYLSSRLDGM